MENIGGFSDSDGGYAPTGGEARAGMGFAGTGSGLSGTGSGAAQAGFGGGGYGAGAGYYTGGGNGGLTPGALAQLAADNAEIEQAAREAQQAAAQQAAREQAAREAVRAAEQQAAFNEAKNVDVAALKPNQVAAILADTNYPQWLKDLVTQIQPAEGSTLEKLGLQPGVTSDQYFSQETPEQRDARMNLVGKGLNGVVNAFIGMSPMGATWNAMNTAANVLTGKETVGQALTKMGTAYVASKLGIPPGALNSALAGDLGGVAQSLAMGQLNKTISNVTGLPSGLVSMATNATGVGSNIKSAVNTATGSTPTGFSTNKIANALDNILGTASNAVRAFNAPPKITIDPNANPYNDVLSANQQFSLDRALTAPDTPTTVGGLDSLDRVNVTGANTGDGAGVGSETVPSTATYGTKTEGALAPVTITAKRLPNEEEPPSALETVPSTATYGTKTEGALAPVTITAKRLPNEEEEIPTPVMPPNVGTLEPVTGSLPVAATPVATTPTPTPTPVATTPKPTPTPVTSTAATPTGGLPTVSDATAAAGRMAQLGKMGSSEMGYNQNLRQLNMPELTQFEMPTDETLSNVDVNKALAALAAYAPNAERDIVPQFFAEGGQPDAQNLLDSYQRADMQKALKNLGEVGSGLTPAKPRVLSLEKVGGPNQQQSLRQMGVVPQLAAILRARGMRLAEGGQPDHTHPHYDGTPLFRTGGLESLGGKYVEGKGDGTSDDIAAMLANGEYVFSADVVAALGNGSNKAGAEKLDEMVQSIRARARSAPPDKLPPDAKSPLEYLKSSKGKKHD